MWTRSLTPVGRGREAHRSHNCCSLGPLWRCSQHGQMPLFWAAYNGHLEVAKVLVTAGAELLATDTVRLLLHVQHLFPPP